MEDMDTFMVHLIQRTPHVDTLAKQLYRKGFPTFNTKRLATQYLKSRRLYDILFQDCFGYDDIEKERLQKVFYQTSNGEAAELLFSLKHPPKNSFQFWRMTVDSLEADQRQSISDPKNRLNIRISTASMLQIFTAAKIGNVTKMEHLMRDVAAKCVLMHLPYYAFARGSNELDNHIKENISMIRASLKNALLNKRDWIDKTLLHVAINAKTTECMNIVLRYALEAGVKEQMLDSRDAFGNTPLHLAIRRKLMKVSKKLILEGADIFLMNNQGEFPLQLIYQKFPKLAIYIMDKAVTVNGYVTGDNTYLNVDFGILSTYINLQTQTENRLNPRNLFGESSKRKLEREATYAVEIDDKETVQLTEFSAERNLSPSPNSTIYSPLDPQKLEPREEEMQILASLVYSDVKACAEILSHPVARLFLNLKWNRMKHIVWINSAVRVICYLIYFALMFRIYFVDCPHMTPGNITTSFTNNSESVPTNSIFENMSVIEHELYANATNGFSTTQCVWSSVTYVLLPLMICLNLTYLMGEIIKVPKIMKLSGFRLYWFSYLGMGAWTRILFFLIALISSTVPALRTSLNSYHYLVAIVGVLLASILLLQVIGDSNWDSFVHSIYIHVYMKVMSRFLSVITTFSAIILGFAICFSITFPQPKEFSTFARSLFRLLIMMHGEFDFETKTVGTEAHSDKLVIWTGQVLYVLFGSVVTLVLIDVFLGYTVSDIKELTDKAEITRHSIQVQQIFIWEHFLVNLKKRLKKSTATTIDNSFQIFVIPLERQQRHRCDVMVSFEELPQSMTTEFVNLLNHN